MWLWRLFSCSAIKLSTEPTSTNLSDILKIESSRQGWRSLPYDHFFTSEKTSFVQSDAANDNFSLVKFHRSRRWLAATKNRTIFSSLSSQWINLSTYEINPYMRRSINFRRLGYKSRTLVSLRVLTTKQHHFLAVKVSLRVH